MLPLKGALVSLLIYTCVAQSQYITQRCGQDDFRCNNDKCIESRRRCDRVADCPDAEDEENCSCTADEFQCIEDGNCIEARKRCDGVNHCSDGSDEIDCDNVQFRCSNGKVIPQYKRCDRQYDCLPGDYSDEQYCPCGDDDFKCDNGHCIPAHKQCDGTHDCQDRSDERNCINGNSCPTGQILCTSIYGTSTCANLCDGNPECDKREDEDNCPEPCYHKCDGKCLEQENICDEIRDCSDGSDELDCIKCDGPTDFRCKSNECIDRKLLCNNIPECEDESDEENCNVTMISGPRDCNENQAQCRDGTCINSQFYCDGTIDCSDGSDEENCPCKSDEFQCSSGKCILGKLHCDQNNDCDDGSDEVNCDDIYGETTRPTYVYTTRGYGNGGRGNGGYDDRNQYPDRDYTTQSSRDIYDPWNRGNGSPYDNSPPYGGSGIYPDETDTPRPNYGATLNENTYPGEQYPSGADRDDIGGNRPDEGSSSGGSQPVDRRPSSGNREENIGAPFPGYPDVNQRTDSPYVTNYRPSGPISPPALNLRTYPNEQSVRYAKYQQGGDVVFRCRDEGPQRAAVRWVREGGRPLKSGSTDRNGRLEMNQVTTSDSGVYICQAVNFLSYPGSELRVSLTVERQTQTVAPSFPSCLPTDATCRNGKCISKSSVCDGVRDCSDGSDEDSCVHHGFCEPNQFKCANKKCVLKSWVCDAENDCDDGSDEENCGPIDPGRPCLPVEFTCNNQQCIPKSYQCDGVYDCLDKSDEMTCAAFTVISPPTPAVVHLNTNDTLRLTCAGHGVPTVTISWRLNWGHVPPQCVVTSVDGYGTLTCPNMQHEHSGAYSCEAITHKGSEFIAPDAIVFVNQSHSVCPSEYFNSDARSPSECIRCFCFGKSTQCDSAELFIYNMPSPLGQGGTRLVGITLGPNGEPEVDSEPITNRYYYQQLRNGATVTKVQIFNPIWPQPTAHPYLTLPASYNGNQLTSYGGQISYLLSSHSSGGSFDYNMPDIIIKGKYESLIYYQNGPKSTISTRFLPGQWNKTTSRGYEPATREDIMMALDNVEMILLRADLNKAGVNITDFVMESAQYINTGLGPANLVEECKCPPGYDGLSCQKCASGYERDRSGPWLGSCVPERKTCPPGTYGDPANGYACKPCPCPFTSPPNQFARTCHIGFNGRVVCDCLSGYEGNNCDHCAPNYEGNPLVIGDSCRPRVEPKCNAIGTSQIRSIDDCVCKDNVEGRYCDQCKNDAFYLSADFRHGCASCFCSGVTQTCTSSNLRRKTTYMVFNTPQIISQLHTYSSTASGPSHSPRYNAPVQTILEVVPRSDGATALGISSSRPTVYYWSLPISFAGDKVTSYGGYMHYTLKNVPLGNSYSMSDKAADVQLVSNNSLTFHYFGDVRPGSDGTLDVNVQLFEDKWQRTDGKDVSREQFLLALADVKTILIKATYNDEPQLAIIESASIETAEEGGTGPVAVHVEKCACPIGYIGTSCEDCAPGYKRSSKGIYLEFCEPCDCNGHSSMCDADTGACYSCQHNTYGDNCEECKPGYTRDVNNNCVAELNVGPCSCDDRGQEGPCDVYGNCHCKQNVEGRFCDECRNGTFGLDARNPKGCLSCFCSGVTTECHEGQNYHRIPMAAPIFGSNFGGYTITNLDGDREYSNNFVPLPKKSELRYSFEFPPSEDLYWSLPEFPGNKVLSYGGTLQFEQNFEDQYRQTTSTGEKNVVLVGDHISVFWNSPSPITSGQKTQVTLEEYGWYVLHTVTPASRNDFMNVLKSLKRVLVKATLTPFIVATTIADVSMDTASTFSDPDYPSIKSVEVCMCPQGYTGTSCESCTPGYYKDERGYCSPCNCNGHECEMGANNEVICNCRLPYTGPDCSTFGSAPTPPPSNTRPPPPSSSLIVTITSPTIMIKDVGSTATFTCHAQSALSRGRLLVRWSKAGGSLPYGRSVVSEDTGSLLIHNLQDSDTGKYICETSDGLSTAEASASLTVGVNQRTIPQVSIVSAVKDYVEGQRIELECRATGNPAPTLSWRRAAGYPLPGTANVQNGFLIIEEAREDDSGEYRCTATNTEGTDDRIAVVNVRPKPYTTPREKLTVSNTSPTIDQGQSISVVCTGTPSVPPGSIQWIRQDGSEFYTNMRSDNGVLHIDGALPENQGVYICQTPYNSIVPIMIILKVIPLGTPPPSEASNITTSSQSLKIPTGGTGSVDCSPLGYPPPLIRWKKYDGDFGAGTSQRGNTLLITNAQENDQGYYMCEGIVDRVNVAVIYVFVEIEKREPPEVSIWPQEPNLVTIGTSFELHCQVQKGVPEPDVTWDREGGRPLTPTTQIQPHNVLKFENIDVNDEGAYTCTASNSAGKAQATSVIRVQSIPSITMTPTNYITVTRGNPINFECRARGYPMPMVSIRTKDFREIVPPTSGIAALRISSASERDDGEYICQASSTAGNIEESFVIIIDRGDLGFEDDLGSGYEDYNQQLDTDRVFMPEGKDAVIRCNSGGYEVMWTRSDRRQLQPNAIQSGAELIIQNASRNDAGDYECTILNGDQRNVEYRQLIVISAPRVTLNPPSQTVRPGESTTVDCIVDGDEIQEVTWLLTRPTSNRIEVQGRRLFFHQIEVEDAGEYNCFARNPVANVTKTAKVIIDGPPSEYSSVTIDQQQKPFRAGENVELLCRTSSSDVNAVWERYGTNQYVHHRKYNNGVALVIENVKETDAGVYRCIGEDRYGQRKYVDYNLEVLPGSNVPSYPPSGKDLVYTAHLGQTVDMPCQHDLDPPVSIEWRKEYSTLPSYAAVTSPVLSLYNISENDAGIYICRINNRRASIEARATLRVEGLIPRFDGNAYIALPTLKDAYMNLDIEITFKPADENGLLLYNSNGRDGNHDYLAIQLISGIPQFVMVVGAEPVIIEGDRPLQLNAWHTIKVSRNSGKVSMYVDETGPFNSESIWEILDLSESLYIGNVPDYFVLPPSVRPNAGFVGCVSMLVLSKKEKNLVADRIEWNGVEDCNTCVPNLCLNDGVCQEARNERGYMCLCAQGYAGLNCNRTGEACRPGICGPGKCTDTVDGYTCACPVTYTGRNCDSKQYIEYPAFTGSAYLAIKAPSTSLLFRMSMKVKATMPVTDGIIMYCAESARGTGGFTSLAVHNRRLEFRYDLGDGSEPVIITATKNLTANEWTDVNIARVGSVVSLKVNLINSYEGRLGSHKRDLTLETPMFVGGVDDSIVLNNNTGVTGGFNGCIKEVQVYGDAVDIVNSSIRSANVKECSNSDRGDIPDIDTVCSQCRNGGACESPDSTSCSCPYGYTGQYCEISIPSNNRRMPRAPCAAQPCRNGGTCTANPSSMMNYTCDCPLGYSGTNCQMPLELLQSVGFNGNGYLELPANLLRYDDLESEPAVIALAMHTTEDGILLYQRQGYSMSEDGDYILLKVENGVVVMEWDFGGGSTSLSIRDIYVVDGERHTVIAKLLPDGDVSLSVDTKTKYGKTDGLQKTMNADSNIYVGGIPDRLNFHRYSGLTGCIEQVELMEIKRGLNLGRQAVAARNTQLCKDPVA